jgi:hypothetical protein
MSCALFRHKSHAHNFRVKTMHDISPLTLISKMECQYKEKTHFTHSRKNHSLLRVKKIKSPIQYFRKLFQILTLKSIGFDCFPQLVLDLFALRSCYLEFFTLHKARLVGSNNSRKERLKFLRKDFG